MRAIGVRNGKGNADALYIEDNVPDPVTKPGYVIVGIKAFGLNRMDIMQREDRYPYKLLPESGKIMGVEFSGVVMDVGPECTGGFKEGEKVFGLAYGGAYSEKIAVSEKMLIHMPSEMTFEYTAGVCETYFTALQATDLLGSIKPGQKVLVHAGASGVGQSAIQLAALLGASKIYTTAGTDAKCTLCLSLGATHAINYRSTPDFSKVVLDDTNGKGVDLIIDLVGRDYWHMNIASLAMDSRMVIVAAMSGGDVEGFSIRQLMNKRIWVMATTLRTRDTEYQGMLRDRFVEIALPALMDGRLKVTVDQVFPWSKVADAHTKMEANENAGKLICRVE